MPDDRTNPGPADRSRINLTQDWEVDYWTKQLGVPLEKLRQAIHAVGTNVDKVREYLGR
jgi:hypothetical protein